jgi:type I restriction enzyme S subunit
MNFSKDEVEQLRLQFGDLLVCEGGDIGRTAMWEGQIEHCCFQNHLHRLRAIRDDIHPPFFVYWLQAAFTLLNLYKGEGNRTTIPNLSQSRLKSFILPKPPLPEQRAIAHVLNTVRRSIEATERVIAAARELKRSLMKHLFTYGPVPIYHVDQVIMIETEIGEVPNTWEIVPLGLIIDYGPQNGLYKPASDYGEGSPILRIEAFENGDLIEKQSLKKLRLSPSEIETYSLKENDIVVNRVNGSLDILGKCARVGKLQELTVFESNMMRFSVDASKAFSQFILYYMGTSISRHQINTKARIIHQASINQQDLKTILVPLTGLSDQKIVIDYLDIIDRKLQVEITRVKSLSSLFQSLLTDLMTGRMRVRIADIEVSNNCVTSPAR